MSKYSRRDFLKLASGSIAVAVSNVTMASENPFGFKELQGGYEQMAEKEGSPITKTKSEKDTNKVPTGSCGGDIKKQNHGVCGATPPQKKQAKGN